MSTLPELNFDWSQACGELPEDSMGRAEHARNLTQFLIQKGQEANYVLNLNAKWGTGKTYFLRRWVAEIESTYPTVYIDAWSSDHSSDPLLSVVSEVKNKLRELKNISRFEAALFKGLAKAVKATAPLVIKAVVKGQLKRGGVNLDEFGEAFSNGDAADAGAKLVEQAIRAHNEASKGVENIKKSVRDWLESVVRSGKRQYPLFIFIDELDRCRPTYAVEMLETIKHIFDMKNVVFVVATDKDQLQHSIRAIYGAEFDSRLYLDRFFTRSITLSNPSRANFIFRKIDGSDTFTNFTKDDDNFVFMDSAEGRKVDLIALLSGIADGFNWPLRTVNLWLDRLEAALIISPRKMDIIILSFMMALETDDSDWLKKYQDGISIFKEARNDDTGKVNFKSFLITTHWSFGQYKKDLLDIGFEEMTRIMHSERHPQIDLLAFVKNRLNSLDYIGNNSLINLGDEYKKATYAQTIDMMRIGSDSNSPIYESAALYLHGYFHEKNGTNLKHYFDICRYSSLMS
ncbi:KAP family P-loop NTPase fold protein [Pantoea anthophila]|uniref:KAP family P-loop NTPase fold protein n=1 Tax=Pantoea anthophila TaxID=470931 RepID=UPI002DB854A4|nr:P-loop NTPase fold protein [Pantoea anthophila]MEB5708426.1 KAP family NTPase [Pantoea anthophila]MEB6519298.1 KAP family NTPase [Pantoea anthophila]